MAAKASDDAPDGLTDAEAATTTIRDRPPPDAKFERDLDGVDPRLIRPVAHETGMDPATASDDEIRASYTRTYMEASEIDNRLRALNREVVDDIHA